MQPPFPGMDPFLEINPRWQVFHGWFIRKLAELHLPQARERGCWIDVERSVYQRDPSGELVLVGEPDVLTGLDGSASGPTSAGSSGVVLAEPQAVHEIVLEPDQMERYKQDYLVVRELERYQRILAVVEVLSFANKQAYMARYREKRTRFLTSQVHFMEVDLLRAGENASRDLFPELPKTPYFIFVARKTAIGRTEEGYPQRLQDPLPTIGLPLGPNRPDLPLDLAAAFHAAMELCSRPGWIDYEREAIPDPPLTSHDAAWVKQIIPARAS